MSRPDGQPDDVERRKKRKEDDLDVVSGNSLFSQFVFCLPSADPSNLLSNSGFFDVLNLSLEFRGAGLISAAIMQRIYSLFTKINLIRDS